jgi:hypothetical protein
MRHGRFYRIERGSSLICRTTAQSRTAHPKAAQVFADLGE